MKRPTARRTKFTTTLGKIWDCRPCGKKPGCGEGWDLLTGTLGTSDLSTVVTIEQILDSNGVADAVWAFRCLSTEDMLSLRPFVLDCAERVLPVQEAASCGDLRPRECIEAARGYIAGTVSLEELEEKRAAAKAAAKAAAAADKAAAKAAAAAAADFACSSACSSAFYASACASAFYAASYASSAAAFYASAFYAASYACSSAFYASAAPSYAAPYAAEREWQARRLRQYLAGEAT